MTQRSAALPILLWVAALAFLPLWPHLAHHPVLWDLDVYRQTILSLRAGHDPYADGIAAQLLVRDHPALHPSAMPLYTYPYSPITLPLVRWVAQFPLSVTGALYLLLCASSALPASASRSTSASSLPSRKNAAPQSSCRP